MDILLAHGYFLRDDATEQRVMKPYVPLGILSLSAFLKRAGAAVGVFDATFSTREEFAAHLVRTRPPVVGISVNMMTKFAAIWMIRQAKAAGARVVIGGPEPPHYAEKYLDEGADAVVIGEGEITLAELLAHWSEHPDASPSKVSGLVFRAEDGSVARTPARPLMPSIDTLPFPDRAAIDLRPYIDAWKTRHGQSSLSLITMRGCPYTCTWCSHSVYGESYRRRPPALVAEEIALLRREYRPDRLWFADDVFTINHKWLFELRDLLRAGGPPLPFECITRADRLNADAIAALKEMGCARVWIGAESGSQRILDAMRRGVRVGQVEDMTHACRRAGIEVGTFIMLGYDGEEVADIDETARYLRRSRPDIVLTTVAYPIRGTKYHESLGGAAVPPSAPFETWNDRQHRVAGRYADRFYWFANRYIINEAERGRLAGAGKRRWRRRALAFVKSKAASAGMRVARYLPRA